MSGNAGSRITSPWPMIAALVKAEEMEGFGPNRVWQPMTGFQELFLIRYFKPLRSEAISLPEISSIVSRQAAEINAFLKEKGFSIELENFRPGEIGTASVFDILEEWIVEGNEKPIKENGQGIEYPGVRIAGQNAMFYRAKDHPDPIAVLETKNGDVVMMTIAPRAPVDDFDLMMMIEKLEANLVNLGPAYSGVLFPMVNLKKRVDISWILGMSTLGSNGQPYHISQAVMEAIAMMNQVGIHMKIAVAFAMEKCCIFQEPENDLEINQSFLIWIIRPGLTYPLAYAYITPSDWEEPADLEG